MKQEKQTMLAMNDGLSSIQFELYRMGGSPQRRQRGEVECYGFHGLSYSFLMEELARVVDAEALKPRPAGFADRRHSHSAYPAAVELH